MWVWVSIVTCELIIIVLPKAHNKVVSFSLRGKEIFNLPVIHQWPTLPAPRTRPST
jgi:hypothetical protein